MYGLLTKRDVKMAGYWPSSFFVYLWVINWCPIRAKWICACRRPSKIRKLIFKNETLYNMNFHIVKCFVLKAILTEHAWSIKDLLYGIKHQNMINVPYRTKPISPVGKTAPSCPFTELVI